MPRRAVTVRSLRTRRCPRPGAAATATTAAARGRAAGEKNLQPRASGVPAALAALLLAAPAFAEDLSQVIVTAIRTEQPVDEALASVTVFTRELIEASQARSIEDLLRGVEGITIGNSGGAGKATSFFVRGTESDHLLVLVDGVRIGSATTGAAALQNLPLEQVERIEFVRGPRSSLYGSEAIGGVLQLFTRRGARAPTVAVGGGSFGTRQIDADFGLGGERAWLNLAGSAQSIDGYDACRGSSTQFAGCFTEEPDADSYDYRSLAASGGLTLGAATALEASWWRTDSDVEFDGSFANRSRIVQQVASLALRQPLGARATLALRAGRARDVSDDFLQDEYTGSFETTRDTVTAQLEFAVADRQRVSAGIDYLDDRVGGTTGYEVTARDNLALYLQYVGSLGRLRTEASLRRDENEQFGGATTGGIGLAWPLTPAVELIAQYGTGFKAPSFNELYYPYFGNPALQPERSQSAELAAQGGVHTLRWRVSAFDTRIRDLVGFDASFVPANIDRTRIQGLEARGSIVLGNWTVESAASLLDPENVSAGADQGKRLPRRPDASGHLDVERRAGRYAFGARLVAEGSRYDDSANTRRVPGHATLDLRADAQVAGSWRVQIRAANVLDADYETLEYFPQPGRAFYLTLRHGWGEPGGAGP